MKWNVYTEPQLWGLDNQMWKSGEKQTSRPGINWFSDY